MARYALGGRTPNAAFAPADAAELSVLMRDCNDAQDAVVFFGGGTMQSIGSLPTRNYVAIDLRRLDRIAPYEVRDRSIVVGAGATLRALDSVLAAHGRFVQLDAPRRDCATVGGTVASGWLGPRRAAYGPPRDFVLSIHIMLADGTSHTSDDVVAFRSLSGAAAIVSANLRTLPMPAARRIAIAGLPHGTRERAAAHVRALQHEPAAALIVRGFAEVDGRNGADGRIVLLLEGSQHTVDVATRDARSALGASGVPETQLIDAGVEASFARLLDAYVAHLGRRSATYRCAGSPHDARPRLEALERIARAHRLTFESIEDIRSGDAIVRLSARLVGSFAERILAFDAACRSTLAEICVLDAPDSVRRALTGAKALPLLASSVSD